MRYIYHETKALIVYFSKINCVYIDGNNYLITFTTVYHFLKSIFYIHQICKVLHRLIIITT